MIASPPPAPVHHQAFSVVWSNIKGTPRMSEAAAHSDIKKTFDLAERKGANFVALCEISWPDYWVAVRDEAHAHGYKVVHQQENAVAVPIGTKTKFAQHLLSKGIAHLTPNRTEPTLTFNVGGLKVKASGTHLVSRWQHYTHNDVDHAIRAHLAHEEVSQIKDRGEHQVGRGFVTIKLGDFNAISKFLPGSLISPLDSHNNMDRMMQGYVQVPAGMSLTKIASGRIGTGELYTDHPIKWARFNVTY